MAKINGKANGYFMAKVTKVQKKELEKSVKIINKFLGGLKVA